MPIDDPTEHWTGAGGDHWAAEHARHDRMLAPFSDVVLQGLDPQPGERVLDVGCGNGALSWAAAERVAPGGAVVGLDLSPQMLAVARRRSSAPAGVSVTFEQGDAQTDEVGDGFDAWISRFGVMFFKDPEAAFANLAGALRPGGRIAFVCWRGFFENEWQFVPAGAALEHVAPPPLAGGYAPGPFALAEPDFVTSLLTGAGFEGVGLEPADRAVTLGDSVEDALGYLLRSEFARILLDGTDEATIGRVRASVTGALEGYAGPDGVALNGAVWLVTARRP
jgi:SAM-dependent methyltransferase